MNRLARGFTLIEMSLVIAIVGFFVVSVINVTKSTQSGTGVVETRTRMDQIQRALQAYVTQHSCLPCPADGTLVSTDATAGHALAGGAYVSGTTFCASADCTITADGVVPWLDIGLSEDDVTDAWGSRMRYAVGGCSALTASCDGATTSQTYQVTLVDGMRAATLGTYPSNGLYIADFDTTTPLTNATTKTTAVYVVSSTGPDRSFAYVKGAGRTGPTAFKDEYAQANTNAGQDVNARAPTQTYATGNTYRTFARGSVNSLSSTAYFDDIVAFTSASTMVYKCGAGACGNPN